VFAPGHLGELTQVLDVELVDAVAAETGTVQQRVRLLPTRVVIFFVLALALFEGSGYRQVWGKLVTGLGGPTDGWPTASALTRARRRVGARPLRLLFDTVCGPVAWPATAQAFWCGLRVVALDATSLHVRDSARVRRRYRKRKADTLDWGYPLLRLTALVECGTRALVGAVFGPETDGGEIAYAGQLLDKLQRGMLLLLDAGYDSWRLLADIGDTGAAWLCRSGAYRSPLILRTLPDGSYLSVLGYGRLQVRVVEAWLTITYADGTVRTEQWRLVTSLLDHTRYPAAALVELYHQRWQVETTYFSIKCSILHGRVLRSDRAEDIEQEVYALLTVYQSLVRVITDAVATQPGTDPRRASFTTALETARDQLVAATHSAPPPEHLLIGAIGRAVLATLLPTPRHRVKARSRKHTTSKYARNAGTWPATTTTYTITSQIAIMTEGLTPRSKR
jgi:hypothetical protein